MFQLLDDVYNTISRVDRVALSLRLYNHTALLDGKLFYNWINAKVPSRDAHYPLPVSLMGKSLDDMISIHGSVRTALAGLIIRLAPVRVQGGQDDDVTISVAVQINPILPGNVLVPLTSPPSDRYLVQSRNVGLRTTGIPDWELNPNYIKVEEFDTLNIPIGELTITVWADKKYVALAMFDVLPRV